VQYGEAGLARLNDNPLYRALGIEVKSVADGSARAVLAPTVNACWPSPAQPHGGVLFTVMDTTMAFAALSHGDAESGCATVDCSIQYLAPARDGPFVCQVATTRRTGRTVFVRAEILDAKQAPVAMGQATFRLFTKAG
jgi:uncharacterized protein (TIGR00369 family)